MKHQTTDKPGPHPDLVNWADQEPDHLPFEKAEHAEHQLTWAMVILAVVIGIALGAQFFTG